MNDIICEYISLRKATELLKKYKVYIFKYNKNSDILYLEYPFKFHFSSNNINTIENTEEEDIKSFSYVEVRLTDKIPVGRISVNMLGF
jgi:hypothetical protein